MEVFHFTTEVRVRLPETDAMGIVFHGHYFTYMEVGRVDYLRNLGLAEGIRPIRDFENVVAHAECDFKSPARLDDPLVISVRVAEIRKHAFRFRFKMVHRKENRLVARGSTVHCAVDEDLRPTRIPQSFVERILAFEGEGVDLSARG